MCDGHGGGGLVASLYAAMLAEGDIEALVNKRLIGVVVVGQQSLLELALFPEDSLKKRERDRKSGSLNLMADTRWRSQHMHGLHVTFTLADSLPTKHALRETGGGGMLLQKKFECGYQPPAFTAELHIKGSPRNENRQACRSFVCYKTFLKLHRKTVWQHSPEQLR